ncbi:pentapeptide repeat-containing protein [Nocardia gipuzkoensis]
MDGADLTKTYLRDATLSDATLSGSAIVKCWMRRRVGRRWIPPVWARNRLMCCSGIPRDAAIALNDSPARHLSHTSS